VNGRGLLWEMKPSIVPSIEDEKEASTPVSDYNNKGLNDISKTSPKIIISSRPKPTPVTKGGTASENFSNKKAKLSGSNPNHINIIEEKEEGEDYLNHTSKPNKNKVLESDLDRRAKIEEKEGAEHVSEHMIQSEKETHNASIKVEVIRKHSGSSGTKRDFNTDNSNVKKNETKGVNKTQSNLLPLKKATIEDSSFNRKSSSFSSILSSIANHVRTGSFETLEQIDGSHQEFEVHKSLNKKYNLT